MGARSDRRGERAYREAESTSQTWNRNVVISGQDLPEQCRDHEDQSQLGQGSAQASGPLRILSLGVGTSLKVQV
jgi:hypothetical protein